MSKMNITKTSIIQTLDYRTDQKENAKFLRDKAARELRKEGYRVKVETFDFTDLGKFKLYRLTAIRMGKVYF